MHGLGGDGGEINDQSVNLQFKSGMEINMKNLDEGEEDINYVQ